MLSARTTSKVYRHASYHDSVDLYVGTEENINPRNTTDRLPPTPTLGIRLLIKDRLAANSNSVLNDRDMAGNLMVLYNSSRPIVGGKMRGNIPTPT